MHFANTQKLTVLALAWAALLFGYDYRKNPKPAAAYWAEFISSSTRPMASAQADVKPHLLLSMPHLCCSGCLSDVREAIAKLSWLGPPRIAAEPPSIEHIEAKEGTNYANQLDVDIVDVEATDFVALDRALRDAGLAAERIELSGVGHFRLSAELKHLCCSACTKAADQDIQRTLKSGPGLRWLDSVTVNKEQKTVVFHARYNAVVDLEELLGAMARHGFSPSSVRIAVGAES